MKGHKGHKTKIVKSKWGISQGNIIVSGEVIHYYNADIDLYLCEDCNIYSYLDWHDVKFTTVVSGDPTIESIEVLSDKDFDGYEYNRPSNKFELVRYNGNRTTWTPSWILELEKELLRKYKEQSK